MVKRSSRGTRPQQRAKREESQSAVRATASRASLALKPIATSLASKPVATLAPVILPEVGFARERTVLQVMSLGRSTWWLGIKTGRYPKPVRIGKRAIAWKVEDIRALIARLSAAGA